MNKVISNTYIEERTEWVTLAKDKDNFSLEASLRR